MRNIWVTEQQRDAARHSQTVAWRRFFTRQDRVYKSNADQLPVPYAGGIDYSAASFSKSSFFVKNKLLQFHKTFCTGAINRYYRTKEIKIINNHTFYNSASCYRCGANYQRLGKQGQQFSKCQVKTIRVIAGSVRRKGCPTARFFVFVLSKIHWSLLS